MTISFIYPDFFLIKIIQNLGEKDTFKDLLRIEKDSRLIIVGLMIVNEIKKVNQNLEGKTGVKS